MIRAEDFESGRFYTTRLANPPSPVTDSIDSDFILDYAKVGMTVIHVCTNKTSCMTTAWCHSQGNPKDWVFVVTPSEEDPFEWDFLHSIIPNAVITEDHKKRKILHLDRIKNFFDREKVEELVHESEEYGVKITIVPISKNNEK